MLGGPGDARLSSAMLLAVAGGTVYFASRAILAAMGSPRPIDPARRALVQWLPIMAAALASVFMHAADVAVTIVFGTSVATLTLVLGMMLWNAPLDGPPRKRRVWPFLLPAALIALVAGFSAQLTWLHALMMLTLGVAVLGVWVETDPQTDDLELDDSALPRGRRLLQLIFAAVLAILGGAAGVRAIDMVGSESHVLPAGAAAAAILSPLLILPSLGSSSMEAQRGCADSAAAALVGAALLNLCALLPAVILLNYLVTAWAHRTEAATMMELFAKYSEGTPFPIAAWRLDTVLLVVLGFGLIPVGQGRWALSRIEALLLVVVYAIYVAMAAALGARLL